MHFSSFFVVYHLHSPAYIVPVLQQTYSPRSTIICNRFQLSKTVKALPRATHAHTHAYLPARRAEHCHCSLAGTHTHSSVGLSMRVPHSHSRTARVTQTRVYLPRYITMHLGRSPSMWPICTVFRHTYATHTSRILAISAQCCQ